MNSLEGPFMTILRSFVGSGDRDEIPQEVFA